MRTPKRSLTANLKIAGGDFWQRFVIETQGRRNRRKETILLSSIVPSRPRSGRACPLQSP